MAVFTGLGSAASPSITFSADTNTGIFSPGADTFAVTVGGTKRLEVDSAGTVIIPSSGKIRTNRIENSETNDAIILDPVDDSIQFVSNNQEIGRFTAVGNLLLGTPNQIELQSVSAGVQLHALPTINGASLSIARFLNDGPTGGQMNFGKSRSGVLAPGGIVQANDTLGTISFCGDDGTNLDTAAARIRCLVDDTPGASDMPGRLVFFTTPSGSSSPTERMRIDNTGRVYVGTTESFIPASSTTSGSGLNINVNGGILSKTTQSIGSVFFEQNITGYSSGTVVYQRFRIGGASIGSINSTNGTSITYSTTSDYRLKENVVNLDNAISRLNQLSVYRFNFISNPDDSAVDGFLAHEVQDVVPEAITGEKDGMEAIGILTEWNGMVIGTDVSEPNDLTWEDQIEVSPAVEASYDKEGNEITPGVDAVYETVTRTRTWVQTGERPVYQEIDQAKLVPLLTAALQEAVGRIELLEAEVTGLKA